ncbi:MAG: CPBP family intramembrane glutamic endopeptidase [Actinomycetes bacterium]
MLTDPDVLVDAPESDSPLTWRAVFATSQPVRVLSVTVLLAAAVFGYEALLITAFDARAWWGHELAKTATSFLVVFAVILVLAWRRAPSRRGLLVFLATGWVGISLVSWVPRQRPPSWPELAQLGWWAFWCVVIYVTVPVAYALVHRQSIRSYGLRMGLFRGELRIFAVLLPVIVAGAYLSAGQPRFQATYPFYSDWSAGRGTVLGLLGWWAMYAATFVALEFFYRGFLVSAGFRLVGWWAIPAMAAPYCLLHLDKPLPEMVMSLFGGLVLGVVALRTRSILAGVLAHVTLAVGTDAAVLARR